MKVILIGHGKTGVAFKEAVEMIFGKAENLIALTFAPGEGLKDVCNKIITASSGIPSEQILIVTDLYSGTPYNAAASLVLKGKAKDVIAGMSLPILLEIVTKMNSTSITDIVKGILQDSGTFTTALSAEMQKQEEEDDF
ncbi:MULTISPECIES: PTS sugar transporter subunit IIA [Lactobacillus]|uniref:PTS sugar transporter subunit IIA n=1 Tax=Lactobacillus TaxID=1578 RepID=UPI000D7046EE|nr:MULTISPECIES: mannose/fructose/sorbose PTS transporter subunit IIA [Lactobacillus]AWN32943.1 PTS sorbose transporter subunit IIC [Lactobacillus helsingborgensis]RMC54575.1 PTS sorbose transporter subunit IIC [Lactobacillus sp. ESL0262]